MGGTSNMTIFSKKVIPYLGKFAKKKNRIEFKTRKKMTMPKLGRQKDKKV